MNLEEARAQVQLTRTLAPRLYATSGGHDLDTDPALIHPPAWMCHPCQDRWGQWGGAEPTATVEAERRERRRYEQTRQPWALTRDEDTA